MYIQIYLDHFKKFSFFIGSMEVNEEQMIPAPPDFSVSPSPSVLLDRVRKALNTEIPKQVSGIVELNSSHVTCDVIQPFCSCKQQLKIL